MIQSRFIKNRVTLSILLMLTAGNAQAVKFNIDVLDAQDKTNIDFSRFSQSGYVMPDEYQLQVTVNGESLGNERVIPFYLPEGMAVTAPDAVNLPQACLSLDMVDLLGLTASAREKVTAWRNGQCADFSALPGFTLVPDLGASLLKINVPQAWLEYSDDSWLPPSRWDHGIPGLLLDYNLNASVTRPQGGEADSAILA